MPITHVPRVFLSYSLNDQDRAAELAAALHQLGVDAQTLNETLAVGGQWSEEVERSIREADGIVCLVSGSASKSSVVRREWEVGLSQSWERPEFRLVPVVDPEVDPPGFFHDRHWIRLPNERPDGPEWSKVAAAIVQALTGEGREDERYRSDAVQARKDWTEQIAKVIAPRVQAEKIGR